MKRPVGSVRSGGSRPLPCAPPRPLPTSAHLVSEIRRVPPAGIDGGQRVALNDGKEPECRSGRGMQRQAARAGLKPFRPRPQWGNGRAALPAIAASASPQDGAGTIPEPKRPRAAIAQPAHPNAVIRLLPVRSGRRPCPPPPGRVEDSQRKAVDPGQQRRADLTSRMR